MWLFATRTCRRLEYVSRRAAVEWRQSFVLGTPSGPPARSATSEGDGTLISISLWDAIDAEEIERLAAVLDRSIETIDISVLTNA